MNQPVELLLRHLDGVRETPAGWRAYCPHHQRPPHKVGRGRSLSIAENHAGGVLIHCHAGCATTEVISAVGLELSQLFPQLACGAGGVPTGRGIRGWDWWSLASQLDAVGDKLLLAVIEIADAERVGNLTISRTILASAASTLTGLANEILYGRGVRVTKTDLRRRSA